MRMSSNRMMYSFFVLLCCILTVTSIISIDRLRTTSNPVYANLTMTSWKNDKKESLVNSSAYFNVKIEKMKALVVIAMPKDLEDFEYGNVVFKTTVDVCKVFSGVVATFVVKAVLEHFENTDDVGINCPINMGYYNMTNFQLADMFYPLQKNTKFELTCKVLGKATSTSTFVHMFTFMAYGEYI